MQELIAAAKAVIALRGPNLGISDGDFPYLRLRAAVERAENPSWPWQPVATAPTDTPLLATYLDDAGNPKIIRAELIGQFTQDEPVCWFDENYSGIEEAFSWIPEGDHTIPLYRHPRQPVRLSDEEICEIAETSRAVEGKAMLPVAFARAIEKAIWEKNQ